MFSSLVATLALTLPAPAFAPSGTVYQGIEPQRVFHTNPAEQARLLHSEAWRAFAETDGQGWLATFDEQSGTPRRMWGRGIPVPTGSAATVAEAVRQLLDRHSDLLGFERSTLQLSRASYNARYDTWYVDFAVPIGGHLAYRSGISARVKHGNLISIAAETYARLPRTGARVVAPADAERAAIALGPAPEANHTGVSSEARWVPHAGPRGLELRAAWMVRSRTQDPPGRWVSFVDAETAELLNVHNEVRFADGFVYAEHHLRTPDGSDPVVTGVPLVKVVGDLGETVTAEDGSYHLDDSVEYLTDLESADWVSVQNDDGDNGVLASADPVMTWTSESATPAEINSYVFLQHVRQWGERVEPTNGMVTGPFVSNVNLDMTCNAYWDGNVNFFREGDGCNNTGEIADVNYHEWGHGFHYFQIQGGYQGFDGSLSEGAADIVAFLLTGDHEIAPFFGVEGWPIRDVEPNRRYPEDYTQNNYAVHDNGLIFGGAMWDLWHTLMAVEGEEQGTRSTEHIFAGLLVAGPDVPGSYDEAMVADDDDGDLSNGTPHGCDIIDAFGEHGLGPLGSGTLYLTHHEPLVDVEPDVELPVQVEITDVAPQCFTSHPTGGTLYWRSADKRNWEEVELEVNGNRLDGAIPPQALGTFVEYYLTIDDQSGQSLAAPTGSSITPYSFYVGEVIDVWCSDFEEDDGSLKHKLVAGEERDGADDWQWGPPQGKAGDPPAAHSGSYVWGNDLGLDNFNGTYQPDKHNQLRTPKIDVGHYAGVFLHYWRWLTIEDGAFDQAVIHANKTEVWSNHKSDPESAGDEHHLDDQWMPHAIDLSGAELEGGLQITWDLVSDPGENFGGWTIDDVCVYAPATPDNRLGVTDFTAARNTDGTVNFSWTNPQHKPLDNVVVIRNDYRKPTSPTDGTVVYAVANAKVGQLVEGFDRLATDRPSWYAVYPSDGTDRLSWTETDWNAAFVDGLNTHGGLLGGAPVEEEGEGCGCSTPGSAVGGGWAGLLALVALRLRRLRRS